MELVRSNRTEILVDALASKVRDEPLGAFDQEAIVVQSRGFESWLTLELAKRLGVWANPSFPFPRHLIERLLEVLDPESRDGANAYGRENLRWTVARILGDSPPRELRDYLGGDVDRILRFAGQVAAVLDDYVVYRPELVQAWAAGARDGWQSDVWRAVVSELGPHDLASRLQRALTALRRERSSLPLTRLHLFSLETLPPQFLRFFGELAKLVPTTLYVLEPSRQYLGDASGKPANEAGDGHPFLIGTGRLARDFQQLLLDAEAVIEHQEELFDEPDRSSLLRSVQSDIVDFEPAPTDRRQIDAGDQSIGAHACTGPMREVQVLHDLVRRALEDDPSLKPEDIVVMAPELDTYAPLFRAVFGESERHPIPFDVHDRRSRDDSAFYDDFAAVLELLDSRFSVLDLVRLMDARALRDDYSFSMEERSRLTDLLAAAGIRWGIDAEHRGSEGFPKEDLHTWKTGLDRLFLGFSVMPDSTNVFDGLLPRGAPSLEDAALVARLAKLFDVLAEAHARTRGSRSIERWVAELSRLCGLLFSEDDEASRATHVVRTALGALEESARGGGFEGNVSLRTVRRELDRVLVDKTPAVGFLRRGVTLTELVPLRSVPFRVVCLVGMSEEAFPRQDRRPSFDRTRARHRYGDRNRRHDDRHSFLQALLCARDRLIITYSAPAGGHRVEPNPSPLVWELSECIERYYRAADDDTPLMRPTVHALHAFDERYFRDSSLGGSYSERQLEVARVLAEPTENRPRVELSAEPENPTVIDAADIAKWLWHPSKAFVDEELRARFDTPSVYEPDNALVEIGRLEAATVGNAALRSGLVGDSLSEYLAACPEFPDGRLGGIERARLFGEIGEVARMASALRSGDDGRSTFVRVDLGDCVVESRLLGICDGARVVSRFSKLGRKPEIAAWVEHLLMLASRDASLPRETQLVLRGTETKADVVRYAPVDDPAGELQRLVGLYRACRRQPLPLFEGASRDFVERARTSKPETAINRARGRLKKMRGHHPHLDYVLGADDPFLDDSWTERFREAAIDVYGSMFDHRSEA
jgi:exodeoxyribonuclease V gamma subunit